MGKNVNCIFRSMEVLTHPGGNLIKSKKLQQLEIHFENPLTVLLSIWTASSGIEPGLILWVILMTY